MKINEMRLKSRMDMMNNIAFSETNGMMRLALSDADKEGRDLLKSWMIEESLQVKIDDMGSIYGWAEGSDKNALPICIGSHCDTQPNGGKYDGLYGVMAGLEAISTLKDAGVKTKSPLVLIDWTNEEGARFVPPMLASGVIAGKFKKEWVYEIKDKEGHSYKDELIRIGYMGEQVNRLTQAKFYFEPHIEQGPVLDAEGLDIGIVTGALGIVGLDVYIKGEANHAGSTPMRHRKDALIAAADVMLKLRERVADYGDPAVITMGVISVSPGTKNIVPGEAYFSIDLRYDDNEALTDLENEVITIIKSTCLKYGVQVEISRYWRADPAHFDQRVINAVRTAVSDCGFRSREIVSGAGHDAVFINDIIPTGMLFVPSINGISHSPLEDTKWEHLVKGTEVLLKVLLELDQYRIIA